jgi:hypothetical protein
VCVVAACRGCLLHSCSGCMLWLSIAFLQWLHAAAYHATITPTARLRKLTIAHRQEII